MDYDELLELLKKRRSTRRYKPDPVPDEAIDKIIEAARWAPSGFNQQPWEFVVVKDQKLKEGNVEICMEDIFMPSIVPRARKIASNPWFFSDSRDVISQSVLIVTPRAVMFLISRSTTLFGKR